VPTPNIILKSRSLFINYFYECFVLEDFQVLVCKLNRRNHMVIQETTFSDTLFLAFKASHLSRGFYVSDLNFDYPTDSESDEE